MKTEIKDQSGKVLFTAEAETNRLNIHDTDGTKVCCLEHNGSKLQVKDARDKVVTEMNTRNQ